MPPIGGQLLLGLVHEQRFLFQGGVVVVNQRKHLANIAGVCAAQVSQNRAAVRLVEKAPVCVAGEALMKSRE